MFKKLFIQLAALSYAAADDYAAVPATVEVNQGASMIMNGLKGVGTKFKNLIASIAFPFNDSVCGEKKIQVIYSRVTPVGDSVYANLPIGSICIQLVITSTAVSAAHIYSKQAATSAGWYRMPALAEAVGTTAATAAGALTFINNAGQTRYIQLYSAVS